MNVSVWTVSGFVRSSSPSDFTATITHNLTHHPTLILTFSPCGIWNAVVMGRYVFKPFTFSNGITIPKGSVIECASGAIHYDDEYHADAGVFDPFRWSKMRENEGEKTKHQMVSTEFEYLPFGHGRHAWYVHANMPCSSRRVVR